MDYSGLDYGSSNTVKCPDCGYEYCATCYPEGCTSCPFLSMTTTNTKTPIDHIPTKQDEDKYTA